MTYVQDRLAGMITTPDGTQVAVCSGCSDRVKPFVGPEII